MASSSVCLLLVLSLNFLSTSTKPVGGMDNGKQRIASTDFDAEIDEISKREYQTVHGRILAVNMAHMRRKRETAETNESDHENVFEEIENANKANLSAFYQGDIRLDPELEDYVRSGGNSRNAVRGKKRLWTSRVIPFRIPAFMNHISSNVYKAIQEFHKKTCLRFVNYNSAYHRNYITFGNSDGCSSRVGKRFAQAGKQEISIARGCNWAGTILHEIMHAIGFFHEQSRIDRDKYVKIYWENILPNFKDQFDKYTWVTLDNLGVSYDYQSVMHYDRRSFTKNGKPTIVAIGNENMDFGTADHLLSTRDAYEINALYDCKRKSFGWASWSGWTPCDEKCYRTRERFCYNSGNVRACGGNTNSYGIEKQRVKCPSSICPAPIDGHWGRWSHWRPCSKTCNDGVRTRFRVCDNPRPGHGGKRCPGSAKQKAMCILKRCNLDYDDADFENHRLGMWRNSKSDNLDWNFHRFYTKTINTGPSGDHTTGHGYYLYMESSSTRGGQRAELVSAWRPVQRGGQCLKFYYTMYGKTMGSLAVKVDLSNGKKPWYIFYKVGNQGEGWKKGIANINLPLGLRYKLTIIGRVGNVGYSDIAIDDVYIDPGLCNCQDDYHTCQLWAKKRECSINRSWMKRNCKRSCRVCGGQGCTDNSAHRIHCPKWAAKGECKKNPNFMLVNCKKSCSKDSNPNCPAWAKMGECTKNPLWMLPNCNLSCNHC